MKDVPPLVIWLVGLPASGKSTLAKGLVTAFRDGKLPCLWLDSDELRKVMTPQPTYTDAERDAFYATIGRLAKLGVEGNVHVVISATAMKKNYRDSVRTEVPRFFEVWVRCSEPERRRRDPKGLYAAAARGEIEGLPGHDAVFEEPQDADMIVDSDAEDAEATMRAVLARIDSEWGLGLVR